MKSALAWMARGLAADAATSLVSLLTAFAALAGLLLACGRSPLDTYVGILRGAFGDWFAITETLVAATPILICGLSVAIAAQVGLTNIGAEGQLYMGAVGATFVALNAGNGSPGVVLPAMALAACALGAAWAGIAGVLRARLGVNETILTLLLNYVALLLVEFLIHGPWQDPASFSWPQTAAFPPAAILPTLPRSRVHLGLGMALVVAAALFAVLFMTRVGAVMRVIAANPRAASHVHDPIAAYLLVAMVLSGAVAALAGMSQVSAIEGRLRAGLSAGYGYSGFLAAWLARHHPLAILPAALLMGALTSGGDSLQLGQRLPFATVNILEGVILLSLVSFERLRLRVGGRATTES